MTVYIRFCHTVLVNHTFSNVQIPFLHFPNIPIDNKIILAVDNLKSLIFPFQNAKITAWGLGYKAPKKSFPAKTVLVVEIEHAKLKPEPGAFKYIELRF